MGVRAQETFKRLVRSLEVDRDTSRRDLSYAEGFLTVEFASYRWSMGFSQSRLFPQNEDLYPVPSEKRTWGMWNFIALYVRDCAS